MTVTLQYCNITVSDVDEAVAFYKDALGLELRSDVAAGGFRWVTLGSEAQQEVEIVLSVAHAGCSQADGDATFEAVRASGAEVLQEPTDQPWGRATARSATRRGIPCGLHRLPPAE
jgi:predicted enzyme related to lactoylglutathione lyase